MCEVRASILRRIASTSHFWKRPGARDMTIFGSHIPNIGHFEVHEGIWKYMGICGYMEIYEGIYWNIQVYEGMGGLRNGEETCIEAPL